ncbi:MAG: hypothetical protein VKL39_02870 [Leptolyngbyaceae bacterium]|nr:hypothetical protein [Leptolyngbyaceae bacterium]
MVAFAVTECGLSVDEFMNLSWFEWSLELIKVKNRYKKEFENWEWDWARTRSLWHILINSNSKQKYKPEDLIKLSFDKKEKKKKEERLKPKQVKELFGGKFQDG